MPYKMIHLPKGGSFPDNGYMDYSFGEVRQFLEEHCLSVMGQFYKKSKLFLDSYKLHYDEGERLQREMWAVVWEPEKVFNEFGEESP